MKKTLPFRLWLYFRQGWTTYFAFVFAAINTLTVTYFLAIENYPFLIQIFPNFMLYVLTVASIGLPLLVVVGYVHFKKSPAYRSEADVAIESNPHERRMLINSETMLGMTSQLLNLMIKISEEQKLSESEKKSILKIQDDLSKYMKKQTTATAGTTIFNQNNEKSLK
jgi:hypothetical protein